MSNVSEPTGDQLRAWWEAQGRPPVTVEDEAAHFAGVVQWLQATTVAMWATGRRAPYPLFELDGHLVEQVADDRPAIVDRGELVSDALSARIKAMAYPAKPAPIQITVADDDTDLRSRATYSPTVADDFVGIHCGPDDVWTVHEPSAAPRVLSWIEVADED